MEERCGAGAPGRGDEMEAVEVDGGGSVLGEAERMGPGRRLREVAVVDGARRGGADAGVLADTGEEKGARGGGEGAREEESRPEAEAGADDPQV